MHTCFASAVSNMRTHSAVHARCTRPRGTVSTRLTRSGAVRTGAAAPAISLHLRGAKRVALTQHLPRHKQLCPSTTAAATSATAAPVSEPASQTTAAAEPSSFEWQKQWYPVVPVRYLDASKPHALTLLGQPIVIYRDGAGSWKVFEDRCPHRMAPLSEGRLEPSDGTLQCSYHGWRFDSEGKAIVIPQLGDPAALSTACASPRSCLKSFPAQVLQGLLWVWADSSPTAPLESLARPPALCSELDDPSWSALTVDYFFRDLPYDCSTLLENLFDPSHIPFAHHGIMGAADRSLAVPLNIQTVQDVTPQEGFVLTRDSAPFKTASPSAAEIVFNPPTSCKSKQTAAGGKEIVLQFYATPLRPGWTRLHTNFLLRSKLPAVARKLLPLVEWWLHRGQNLVLDSDSYILHAQEKKLISEGSNWKRSFYLPAGADLGVVKYRTWYHQMAGGGVSWPINLKGDGTTELPREVVLDRYSQHTQHCKYCLGALAWVKRAQVACGALAAAAAGALGWLAAAGALLSPKAAVALLLGVVLAAGVWKLQQLEREFKYTDYVHT